MDPVIDVDRITAVAAVVKGLGLKRDSYLDERLYPPHGDPPELQLAYFAAVVAVDHRTSTPFGSLEGYIDGEFYHGADALWRLARRAYEGDEGLFTPKRLAELSPGEAEAFLSLGSLRVWDFYTRVLLLRDLGKKALRAGGFDKLIAPRLSETFKRLEAARAYEDPVRKKALLLAKFLDGRGLAKFEDPQNFEVPVDNHLSRVAYRLGIVDVDYGPLFEGVELTREEDIEIRERIKAAWRLVSRFSGVDPFTLDDFLWGFGRRICTRESPNCSSCPFKEVCKARSLGRYPPEHAHSLTWYY